MNWFPFAMAMMIMVMMMILMMRSQGWFNGVGMPGEWDDVREIIVEEYYAENLKVRVFYNQRGTDSCADTSEYTETGEVKITLFVSDSPKSEIEQKTGGCWLDMGPAIVRVIADTKQVISVTYIKE